MLCIETFIELKAIDNFCANDNTFVPDGFIHGRTGHWRFDRYNNAAAREWWQINYSDLSALSDEACTLVGLQSNMVDTHKEEYKSCLTRDEADVK